VPVDTLLEKELGYLWDNSKSAQEVFPALVPEITTILQQA